MCFYVQMVKHYNICVICLHQIVTPIIPEMPHNQNHLNPELPTINAVSVCPVLSYGMPYGMTFKAASMLQASRSRYTNI